MEQLQTLGLQVPSEKVFGVGLEDPNTLRESRRVSDVTKGLSWTLEALVFILTEGSFVSI